MNKIEQFLNDKFGEVRAIKIDGVLYYAVLDIAKCLNYSTVQKVTYKLNVEDIIRIPKSQLMDFNSSQTGGHGVTFINTNGLHKTLSSTRKINKSKKNEIYKWLTTEDFYKRITNTYKEIEFIEMLEGVLSHFSIEGVKQYKILTYKIDYYIPKLNIAIEFDEYTHQQYSYEEEKGRQKEIENKLNCRFIRVKDKDSMSFNIGKTIKDVLSQLINTYSKDGITFQI